jgi:hypothetical protein
MFLTPATWDLNCHTGSIPVTAEPSVRRVLGSSFRCMHERKVCAGA